MTQDEFRVLCAAIVAAYPRSNPFVSKETTTIWWKFLNDIDYKVASLALDEWIATQPYAPAISDIRKQKAKVETGEFLNESEAWDLVYKAICRSSCYADDDFKSFPPEIQRAVGSPNALRQMGLDENFNNAVESSNFKRAYRNACEQAKQSAQIPDRIKLMVGAVKQLEG